MGGRITAFVGAGSVADGCGEAVSAIARAGVLEVVTGLDSGLLTTMLVQSIAKATMRLRPM